MPDIADKENGNYIISSFEELGIKDKFEFNHGASDIQSTDTIPLIGGKYAVACIKTPQPQGLAEYYSIILFDEQEQESTIGHLDFRVYDSNSKEAKATESIYPEIKPDMRDLPERVKNGISAMANFSNSLAMEISDKYKGQGLGGLLWSLGCGFMETQGVQEILIDDRTKKATGTSFYEHIGAFEREGQRRKFVFGQGVVGDSPAQLLYANTHLNNTQKSIIQKAIQ